jgi:Protein of unknown function (DUF2786)/SprT-like family
MSAREPFIGERTALEAALLRELVSTWDEIAHNHFKGALRRPVLALSDGERRLGEWNRIQRTISISRRLVVQQPWGTVREILKHEMAHQYVDEVLGIQDQTAHGPAFARVCEAHGFDASARGLPSQAAREAREAEGGAEGGSVGPMAAVARRIARLLALAESPNVHEAAAAMNEARRLMLLHNIDPARADEPAGYHFRQVGAVKARNDVAEKVLAGILSRHFFVSVIWVPAYLPLDGRRGRVLELCGTPGNLDVAVFVHGFLMHTSERLWRAHKRAEGIRSDRDRRRFAAGVMIGFEEKLDAGARQSRAEGLVVHADAQREAYLRRRYPRRTSRGGGAIERTPAYEDGRAAGRKIELARPVGGAAGAGALRLLPPLR